MLRRALLALPLLALFTVADDHAVICFDREIRRIQDFTASDDKIREAIESIKPGALSGAHMFDTIVEVAARTKARPGRKILFLISQSQDGGSSDEVQDQPVQVEARH
jgi:hypothetical protein